MKNKFAFPISTFFLLTSAFLLSACSSTPKYPLPPYPIGYVTDSPEVVSAPPRRVAPAAPPALTSTEVITESRYKDGKLKQREVVSKSQYKKGELIKHQSVERKIVSESNKIQ
jgi:hypothetical protein